MVQDNIIAAVEGVYLHAIVHDVEAIVQASRPRKYTSPILLALSASVNNTFGSKWLLEVLHTLGFSSGYNEVVRHKQSVVSQQNLDSFAMFPFPGHFTQWVADNVDHNIVTLNGEGTFHGMGLISISTPSNISVSEPNTDDASSQL